MWWDKEAAHNLTLEDLILCCLTRTIKYLKQQKGAMMMIMMGMRKLMPLCPPQRTSYYPELNMRFCNQKAAPNHLRYGMNQSRHSRCTSYITNLVKQ